jgi:hypothetical protein
MKTSGNMDLPKILLTLVIFTLCLIIFQGMPTRAQTPIKSGQIEKRIEPTPEAFSELAAQFNQASSEISQLKGRLDVLESRGRVLRSKYHDLTEEMSLLKNHTHGVISLKACDREKSLKIEEVHRFTGGRTGPRDMMVSVSQFSITWNQIDTILDKLDEITHMLALPRS